MNKLLRLAALTTVSLAALSANASTVVWDQGPATGTQSGLWVNQTGLQYFADSVSFASATQVSGYNYFSTFDLSGDTSATAFHLVVMADNDGLPGAVLYGADVGFDSYTSLAGGVNEMHFDFAPLQFAAGQTYWIGLSGNGFEAAQPTVNSPQDGSIAYSQGGGWGLASIGDQMFQLTATSAVPETGTVTLMGAGLALLGLAARRRQRN